VSFDGASDAEAMLEDARTEGAVFGLDEPPPSRAVPSVVSTRRGLSDRAAPPDADLVAATNDAEPVEGAVLLEVEPVESPLLEAEPVESPLFEAEPVESVVVEDLEPIESVSSEDVVSLDDSMLLEEVSTSAPEGPRATSGAPPPPPRRSAAAAAPSPELGGEVELGAEAASSAGGIETASIEEHGPVTLASASSVPPAGEAPGTTLVDGVDLATARGFEDLPEEVQLTLARLARVETLAQGEEVGMFGAAIITGGQVSVLPAFADESGAMATESDVIFTRGSLEDSIALRVVSKVDGTRVAVWDPQPLAHAIEDCPWVHDELRLIADRFLALCGATLGPLGDRLDESLRSAVFQRLEVRTFSPGEELTTEGKALPGLFVIGGGRVDIVKGGEVKEQKSPGEFLFATAIMGGSKSPATARAGDKGALALFASRAVAHELMISVPPLLEVLAG
jgi:hypothetical protein